MRCGGGGGGGAFGIGGLDFVEPELVFRPARGGGGEGGDTGEVAELEDTRDFCRVVEVCLFCVGSPGEC